MGNGRSLAGRLGRWWAAGAATAALCLALPAGASAGVCETQKNNTDVAITETTDAQSLVTTTGEGGDLTDVDVHLDIVHPNPEELAVYLQHATFPVSPPIELSSGNGAGGENYTGTILDDEALNSITGAAAPLTGRWRPETPLSAFDGQGDGGAWTITVAEGGEPSDPDTGFLDSWGVTTSSDACDGPPPGGGGGGGGGSTTTPPSTNPAPKQCKKGQKLKQGKCVKKKRKKKKKK
jgi:subtilisin-like proprotein convertase family protein